MPFFSVIIPTYNRAHIIQKTIRSVQKQTFNDWECIVVDDGSKDNTQQLLQTICKEDPRIKYIFQKNAERSAARNNGIKNSSGEYICFLDSDDTFLENHLSELYNYISEKKKPKGLFFTNYSTLNNGTIQEEVIPKLTGDPIPYFFENAVIPARVSISKEILAAEKFDEDIVIVEDTILWTRIANKYPVFHVSKSTVLYLLHEDNSINIKNNSFQKRLAGLKLFFKRYPQVASHLNSGLQNKLLGDAYFGIAKHFIFKKSKSLALKNLLLSVYHLKLHAQLKHKVFLIIMLFLNKPIPEYQ